MSNIWIRCKFFDDQPEEDVEEDKRCVRMSNIWIRCIFNLFTTEHKFE